MTYYILYFDRFSPVIWRENSNVWECKYKDGSGWFIMDKVLYDPYIPNMINKYGNKLVSLF